MAVPNEANPLPPFAAPRTPETSLEFKLTALLDEPPPTNFDAVKVSETIASVTKLSGRLNGPFNNVNPFNAVKSPVEFIVPLEIIEPNVVKDVALAIPKVGLTSIGLFDKTTFTLPVLVVTPVPPLATANGVVDKVNPAKVGDEFVPIF